MGMSGRNIIENLPHVDHNDLKHEFGEYVQLHVTDKETNTMRSRTVGAIVLDPRNITGRYNFMSLETGKEVHGRVTTTTPITEAVIARVEQLGTEQQQPYRNSKMLKYEWRPGHPIADIKFKNQKQKTCKLFFTNNIKNCTSPTRNARKENSD